MQEPNSTNYIFNEEQDKEKVIKSIPTNIKSQIEKVILERNYDLSKKLPRGVPSELANMFHVRLKEIRYSIQSIRKEKGARVLKDINIIDPSILGIYNCCLENELFRSSTKEGIASRKIQEFLTRNLPFGGVGILIGTPTAYCISTKANNNKIMTDNLAVAIMLKSTTDVPLTIIIGNAVNPKKAEIKAKHWECNNSTGDSNIILDKVSRDSFVRYISIIAEDCDPAPCKVILMTSGLWSYSKGSQRKYKKYGLDLNFKDPSIYLTSVYKNLHILAVTKESSKFDFNVRYLHRGRNEIIN